MKTSAQDFKNASRKSITLVGMSGAGKTHISCKLEEWGWHHYSADYAIASKYLKDELSNNDGLSAKDISSLSNYLGKLGNADKGGFDIDTFKARQRSYYDAEILSLKNMAQEFNSGSKDFVHDSTGSLVEIEDEELIKSVAENTLFVYLKTDEKEDLKVLERARNYPKPLFFPPKFLEDKIAEYLSECRLESVSEITPDDFARWVFPALFEARKPKYQRLADLYGVTIPSSKFRDLKSSDEFINIISEHLND